MADSSGHPPRKFGFWTTVKLEVLSDYLSAFTTASQGVGERIYIDAFAGGGTYKERVTGKEYLGSARRALEVRPPFTRLRYFETPGKAQRLERQLRADYPDRDVRVIGGDCNEHMERVLEELGPYRWAPTFAFLDPDGMELSWPTVVQLAEFRRVRNGRKAELWMLFASGGIVRTLVLQEEHQPSREDFDRVTSVTGTTAWRPFYELRRRREISARAAREAYVNLMRWRLEAVLGYERAHALEVPNQRGVPLYHMIFATDHPAGNDIMTSLYRKASARLPAVRDQHKEFARGLIPLFDTEEYVVHEKYTYSPPLPPDEFLERFARDIPDEP
jgi:three-Cys-motif partner protein